MLLLCQTGNFLDGAHAARLLLMCKYTSKKFYYKI